MTREEQWLNGIAAALDSEGASLEVSPVPVWHYEDMLAAIYDAVTGATSPRAFPERVWNMAKILYAVYCAVARLDDPGCPPPTCRIEDFWYAIYKRATGDDTASVPEPVWRVETFLKGIFDVVGNWHATQLTVTGSAPISLPNAIAAAIHALTQYGLCTQASTPTPSVPVPIKCNNGEIKAGKASGLPFAYDLVDGLTNATGTYFSTGIKDDVDDFEYEIKVQPSSGSWYILQSRASTSGPIYGISGSASGYKIALGIGNLLSVNSGIIRDTSHVYTVKASHKNGVATIYVKDETTGEEDTKTATYDTSEFVGATTSIGVFGQAPNKVNSGNSVYYVKLRKSGLFQT